MGGQSASVQGGQGPPSPPRLLLTKIPFKEHRPSVMTAWRGENTQASQVQLRARARSDWTRWPTSLGQIDTAWRDAHMFSLARFNQMNLCCGRGSVRGTGGPAWDAPSVRTSRCHCQCQADRHSGTSTARCVEKRRSSSQRARRSQRVYIARDQAMRRKVR